MTNSTPTIDLPIERAEVFRLQVPLEVPLSVFGKTIHSREYIMARVYAGGHVGTGIGLAREAELEYVVQRAVFPHLLHQPVSAIRATWENARASMRMIGESGLFARALAVVDIAQWDLLGRLLNAPLWRMIGGRTATVPCLAIMGYYRDDDPVGIVRHEAKRLVEAGFTRFKIPYGFDPRFDSERIAALRESVGGDALIGLDVGGRFNSIKEALAVIKVVESFAVDFLEDPFPAHRHALAMQLAQRTPMKIAFGESVSLPGIIQTLGGERGVDIVRPDATHQMGITGYLQGVMPALEAHRLIFPHYFPDIHAPLVGALGGMMIEESPTLADTTAFFRLRSQAPRIEGGMWHLTEEAGLGIGWNEAALVQFRVGA
ncbi:MAG: enolase C-terminal domain-like protein [Chloroflexota bacterium]|nr:enolase C-terminal domain-like protein [Chloroflexota bacterium]